MPTLSANIRSKDRKSASKARSTRRIPGVLYGYKTDPRSLDVDYSDFIRLMRKVGVSSVIDIEIEGKNYKVIVKNYDIHPVDQSIQHVDFMAINMDEKIVVEVPLNFIGESLAVKNFSAIIIRNHETLSIRCLPSDIPHDVEVDISSIVDLHSQITIADLNISENLEVMYLEPEETLCSATAKTGTDEPETPETEVEGEEGEATAEEGEKKPVEGGDEKAEKNPEDSK